MGRPGFRAGSQRNRALGTPVVPSSELSAESLEADARGFGVEPAAFLQVLHAELLVLRDAEAVDIELPQHVTRDGALVETRRLHEFEGTLLVLLDAHAVTEQVAE